MGRAKHCTIEQRKLILQLRKEGRSYLDIQRLFTCSAKMISNAIKYKDKVENRGGKRKTSPQDDRNIVRAAKFNPFKSARQIKSELNLEVSDMTIRRRLLDANLFARNPRKKPLLKKRIGITVWIGIGLQASGEIFCGLMSLKLFCMEILAVDNMFGVHHLQHVNHSI